MAVRLLNWSGLVDKGIRYSKSQVNRKVKDGSFPAPVAGVGRENVWLEQEIDQYISDQIAARSMRKLIPAAGTGRRAV